MAQCPDSVGERLVPVSRDRQVGHVGANVVSTIQAEFPTAYQTAKGVEDLHVDQMRRVKVAIVCQALHERPVRRPLGQHSEHRGRVDHDRSGSLAIATGAHGSNDVSGRGTTGSRSGSPQDVRDRGTLSDPLELG